MKIRPCVRCLSSKHIRVKAGNDGTFKIIQCSECGFNTSSEVSFQDALNEWNGFKVWTLVKDAPEVTL